MNITYLIGNGFDINLKLKTSYQDFYKYYTNKYKGNNKYENKLYIELKKDENNKYENWSDLEITLGKLTSIYKEDYEGFLEDLISLKIELKNYLYYEDDKFDINKLDDRKLIEFLLKIIMINFNGNSDSFSERIISSIKSNLSKFDDVLGLDDNFSPLNINFVNFNYTESLNKVLSELNLVMHSIYEEDRDYFYKNYGINISRIKIKDVFYIHKNLKKGMILGGNDISDIDNNDFKNIKDIREEFLKSENRQALGDESEFEKFKDLIKASDIILCYGLSFGKTDAIYWESLISNILETDKRIIFCIFEENLSLVEECKYSFWKYKKQKRLFLKKFIENTFNYKDDEKDKELIDKIFNNVEFIINSDIFDLNNDKIIDNKEIEEAAISKN